MRFTPESTAAARCPAGAARSSRCGLGLVWTCGLVTILLIMLVTGAAFAQSTTTHYEVIDLGATTAHSTVCPCFFPYALNNAGEAAGFFFGTDGTYNAFTTSGSTSGVMIDISPPGNNRAFARGMNDAGDVVGWTDFFAPQHGFLWNGSALIDLGTLGGTYSDAHDVNSAGQVAGSADTHPQDYNHAAVWEDGDWTDLGTLGGAFSEAHAINEVGMIAGWSWNSAWDRKAVYWNADHSGPYELPFLPGADPGWFSATSGLNDAGEMVGHVQIGTFEGSSLNRAALWTPSSGGGYTVTDLGLLDEAGQGTNEYGQTAHTSTRAGAINSSGTIIGTSFPSASIPAMRPGPWVLPGGIDGGMTNLNDVRVAAAGGWIIQAVSAINDDGVIAATARTLDSGSARAVLLMPVEVLIGDLNNDGAVNVGDLLILIGGWGPCPASGAGCAGDLNDDRVVNVSDLLLMIGNWG